MPKPAPKADDLERLDPAVLIKMLIEAHAEIARLREDLEKLKREKYKSAAPFSRNQPKQNPSKPGRKPGLGTFNYKSKPSPEEITKTVQVTLEQNTCESCGSLLEPAGFRKCDERPRRGDPDRGRPLRQRSPRPAQPRR